ncbi:hypothetical protein GMRT_14162 [Giardia muris]|uniref:C2H2-type domain-containing protein n=1 Tax=Giardia muris TaxID=5742 RepID=A0A4Z1STT0_GIAMU|nr:hypothetical protein GMRT_14162 [Giardia muris]|eukprot:TNJ27048.1 hypothetical protein GMRT_14162 [Giardia muris]
MVPGLSPDAPQPQEEFAAEGLRDYREMVRDALRGHGEENVAALLADLFTREYGFSLELENYPALPLDVQRLFCDIILMEDQDGNRVLHYSRTVVEFMDLWRGLRYAIRVLETHRRPFYSTIDRFSNVVTFSREYMLDRMRRSERVLGRSMVRIASWPDWRLGVSFAVTAMRLASHEPEEVLINCHPTHLPLPAFRLRAEVLDVCMNRRPEFLIVSGPAGCGLVPCIPTFLTELIHCQGGPRIVILVQSLNAAVSARPISIVLSSIGGVVPKVGDVEQLVRDALNGQHPDIPKLCLLDYDTAIRLSASFPGIGAVATFILDEAHLCRSDTDILWALLRSRGRIQDTLPSATLLATGPVPDFLNDGRAELFVLDDPSVYTVTSRAVTLPGINALQEVVQRELIDIIARMYTGNAERGDIVVFYPGATGSADLARSFYNSRNGLENTAEWRLAGSARIHPITQLSHGCTSVEDLYGRLRHMCNEMSENQERTTLVIMCVGRDNSSRVIRNFIARALPDDLHKWVLKVVLLPERADSANDFQRVAAVLETGYCEVRILDPITQIPRVGVKPISHAERTLRLGCLGRICAGTAVCIEPLGGLTARPHREIEAEDLVTLVLRTRKQGVLLENIAEALGFARDSVIGAITHLQNIGCLSSRGEIIDYGKRISAVVGLSPDYALLFLEIAGGDEAHAVAFLVLLYAIVIPRLVDPEAEVTLPQDRCPESDIVTLVRALLLAMATGDIDTICQEWGLVRWSVQTLSQNVRTTLEDLLGITNEESFATASRLDNETLLGLTDRLLERVMGDNAIFRGAHHLTFRRLILAGRRPENGTPLVAAEMALPNDMRVIADPSPWSGGAPAFWGEAIALSVEETRQGRRGMLLHRWPPTGAEQRVGSIRVSREIAFATGSPYADALLDRAYLDGKYGNALQPIGSTGAANYLILGGQSPSELNSVGAYICFQAAGGFTVARQAAEDALSVAGPVLCLTPRTILAGLADLPAAVEIIDPSQTVQEVEVYINGRENVPKAYALNRKGITFLANNFVTHGPGVYPRIRVAVICQPPMRNEEYRLTVHKTADRLATPNPVFNMRREVAGSPRLCGNVRTGANEGRLVLLVDPALLEDPTVKRGISSLTTVDLFVENLNAIQSDAPEVVEGGDMVEDLETAFGAMMEEKEILFRFNKGMLYFDFNEQLFKLGDDLQLIRYSPDHGAAGLHTPLSLNDVISTMETLFLQDSSITADVDSGMVAVRSLDGGASVLTDEVLDQLKWNASALIGDDRVSASRCGPQGASLYLPQTAMSAYDIANRVSDGLPLELPAVDVIDVFRFTIPICYDHNQVRQIARRFGVFISSVGVADGVQRRDLVVRVRGAHAAMAFDKELTRAFESQKATRIYTDTTCLPAAALEHPDVQPLLREFLAKEHLEVRGGVFYGDERSQARFSAPGRKIHELLHLPLALLSIQGIRIPHLRRRLAEAGHERWLIDVPSLQLVAPEAARDDAEEFIDKIRGDHAPNDDEIACAGICAFKVDSGIMIPTLRPDGTCIRATSVCLECLEEGLRYYLRKFYPDGETVARLGEYTAIESLTLASQIVISKGNVTPFAASVARFVDHRTCGVLINHWVHVKVGIVLSYRGFFSRCPEHPAVPLIVNPNANEKEMRCECVTPECKLGMHAFCEDWHLKNACLNAKIFKDIRRCPRCKHGVAFIGGCYCMTCICKQIFCWHCGKGFRDTDSAHDHLNAEHGGVFDEKGLIYDDPTS